MPSYEVRRSTSIKGSNQDVLAFLSDFRNWPTWSPWLILEPSCPLTYRGTQGQLGASYEWDGHIIGAGSMILSAKDADRIDMELHFLRPFKSRAHVYFEVIQGNDEAIVTWVMQGNLPWYLFFLKTMMKAWITMDFDRGLRMLKSQLETGEVHSQPSITGERHEPGQHYIALKGRATLEQLGQVFPEKLEKLSDYAQQHGIQHTAPWFCLYESMDQLSTETEFFVCYPVDKEYDVEPPVVCDYLAPFDAFVIQHKGTFPFLGNAWALAMSATRYKKIKVQNKPMGIERYLSDPATQDASTLTEILLFKRG